MEVRDRIVELRRVKASELTPNPKNWRTHPEPQRSALRAMIESIGYANALLARETKKGLVLIDGHLRAETTPDALVPVLVLDVTEAEADQLLATVDPLAAMAEADAERLAELIADVQSDVAPAVRDMLDDLLGANDPSPSEGRDGNSAVDELQQAIQLRPKREYVVIMCAEDNGVEFDALRAAFKLGAVRRGGYKKGSAFDAEGVQRVVHARDVLAVINAGA